MPSDVCQDIAHATELAANVELGTDPAPELVPQLREAGDGLVAAAQQEGEVMSEGKVVSLGKNATPPDLLYQLGLRVRGLAEALDDGVATFAWEGGVSAFARDANEAFEC